MNNISISTQNINGVNRTVYTYRSAFPRWFIKCAIILALIEIFATIISFVGSIIFGIFACLAFI